MEVSSQLLNDDSERLIWHNSYGQTRSGPGRDQSLLCCTCHFNLMYTVACHLSVRDDNLSEGNMAYLRAG